MNVAYKTPEFIRAFRGNPSDKALSGAVEGGAEVTKNSAGGFDVVQRVTVKTLLPESEKPLGGASDYFQREMKRVAGFRSAGDKADYAAKGLALKGFSDATAAKQAVEQSTHAIMIEAGRQGILDFDLYNGNK